MYANSCDISRGYKLSRWSQLCWYESKCAGDSEGGEKPVDPIQVYSEKELTRELDKVAHLLKAEHDWSIWMAAMQKLEGLVLGGTLTEY